MFTFDILIGNALTDINRWQRRYPADHPEDDPGIIVAIKHKIHCSM